MKPLKEWKPVYRVTLGPLAVLFVMIPLSLFVIIVKTTAAAYESFTDITSDVIDILKEGVRQIVFGKTTK